MKLLPTVKCEITLEHLKTTDMVSDILTKPLGPTDFHRLRRVLLGMDPLKVPSTYTRDPKLHCHSAILI